MAGKYPCASLEKVPVGHGAEDADDDEGKSEGAADSLQKDGVLNLAKSRLLDPDLTVEHLADEVALFILGDPRLVLVAVAGSKRIEGLVRITLEVEAASGLIIRTKELPRA